MARSKRSALTNEEVEHIAELAKIELTESEKELFRDQLGRILDYFRKIDELDLKNVEPTTHVIDASNVFRDDEPRPSLPPEDVLKNAPDKEGRYFRAPRVS